MQDIILPDQITSNQPGTIGSILSLFSSLTPADFDNDVCVNFVNVNWISAEMTTLLGMEMRRLQQKKYKVFTTGMKGLVKGILEKNGFNQIILNSAKGIDTYGTTIPYIEIDAENRDNINNYLTDAVFPQISSHFALEQSFRDAVFEVADNTHVHSNSSILYMCGQYFPKKKSLMFAIADNGISIPQKVNSNKFFYPILGGENDAKLIDWATRRGNSTKSVPSSGLGLFEIKETMLSLGELTIISNWGYWKINNSGTSLKRTLSSPFNGTLIHFNFLLNQTTSYDYDDNDNLSF